MNGGRPTLLSVQQLLSGALGKIPNRLLGDTVLEMRIHAAKSDSLLSLLACRFKVVVSKAPIVAMVVQDSHAVLLGKAFKRKFGGDGFLRRHLRHQMNVLQP
jgi:hypothetical protein